MINRKIFLFLFLLSGSFCFAQSLRPADGAFPFNVLDMNENSLVSCRDLNTEITNDSPRVVTGEDGHLYAGGERLRIYGTNLSAFPEKNLAERNARSLADRGYNCIRFHHTDADWTNCFIKRTSDGRRIIDPAGLDKFDYFVFMMKKYGIYTNLNLLTGRTYTERDGMPAGSNKISDWKNRHLLGFWNKQARDLQKAYAKALLEHVNPYTGIALKDDPALCIVEINNEQGMIHSYMSDNFSDTPDNLWGELEVQWNEWLKKQGKDYTTLSSLYNISYPKGKVIIDSSTKWNLEQYEGAKVTKAGTGNNVSLDITANGKAAWHVQYNAPSRKVENSQVYTISFQARASKKSEIGLSIMMAHEPWSNLGWNKKVTLDKDWKKYEFVISGLNSDSNSRVNFGEMGFLSGTKIEIKDFTMYEGGNIKSVKECANGVVLPRSGEYGELPEEFKKLVLNFLYDVETEYWTDMRDYVRNTLGCPALQMGSAMGNTTTGHSMLFDIVDSHSYFNHPVFPGAGWSADDFYIKNDDLTRQEASQSMTSLAGFRVYGKPFSVSEYDHPYPDQFNAEMYPMWAAFACYQDWDALYTFCSDVIEPNEAKNRKISGYFDQTHNPVKTAAAPVAARIFRTGAIAPAENYVWMKLDEEKERDNLIHFRSWAVGNPGVWGYVPVMAMDCQTGILWNSLPDSISGMDVNEKSKNISLMKKDMKRAGTGIAVSEESLFWEEEKGTFMAREKNAFVYVGRKDSPLLKEAVNESLNNFEFIPSGDFATVMGVRKNDGKWLFFTGSWSGNKGEKLREYGNPKPYSDTKNVIQRDLLSLTCINPYHSGEAQALSVSGTLKSLKGNMKMTPLSEKGLPSGKTVKGKTFEIKEDSGTLWYLIEP